MNIPVFRLSRKNDVGMGAGPRSASVKHPATRQKPEESKSAGDGVRRPCARARALLPSLIMASRHCGLTSLNLSVMQSVILATSGTNWPQSLRASDLQASRVASSTSCATPAREVIKTAIAETTSARALGRKTFAPFIAHPRSVLYPLTVSISHRIVVPERPRWAVHRICTGRRHGAHS